MTGTLWYEKRMKGVRVLVVDDDPDIRSLLRVLLERTGHQVVDAPGRYLGFLALYDVLFAVLCWASFEYVVTE